MKVLIMYASRYGATAVIAEWITERLTIEGWETERREASEAPSAFSGYDLVLMGSGIYANGFLPEMENFIEERKDELAEVKTAFFGTAMKTECMFVKGKAMGGVQIFEKYAALTGTCIYGEMLHGEMVYARMTDTDKKGMDYFYRMAGFSELEIAERKKPRSLMNKAEVWTFTENLVKRVMKR